MTDDETTQRNADRADGRARTSNRLATAAVVVASISALAAVSALVLGLVNRSEQQEKAARDAARSQAEQIDVARGIDHDDVVYVRNSSSKSFRGVVLRLAAENDEFRYAVLNALPACYEWEVTDKALKEQRLRPVAGADGFIALSGSIEVSFQDARGKVWDQPESAPLRENGYWDTKYVKSVRSPEFVTNSVQLGAGTYRRIPGCSGK
ncbi:hypothetical protein [Streptomyces aquilus]|uniref:hypothetical protein n=1 Tax=Streptomyces aquilus TaxID=2548456 RepID=UPI003679C5BA